MQYLKYLLTAAALSFTPCISFSQYITDVVNPLFRGEIDGDLIRNKYAFSMNTAIGYKDSNAVMHWTPAITMGLFSSNSLQITGMPAHKKLPELKTFMLGKSIIYTQEMSGALPQNAYAGNYAIPVFDSTSVVVIANGINRKNAALYEFSVWENNSKPVVPWRDIHLFFKPYHINNETNWQKGTEIAYLGEFKATFGNALTITIRKKGSNRVVNSMSAFWLNYGPSVLSAFTAGGLANILTYFRSRSFSDVFLPENGTGFSKELLPKDNLLIRGKNFLPNENSLLFYLDGKVRTKDIIEYNIVSGRDSGGWKANDFDVNMLWIKNLSPGKHELLIRYNIQRQNIYRYPFSIEYAWYQTIAFKTVTGLLIAGLLGFIYLLYRSHKQKQSLVKEQQQNQQTQTSLKTIRSQFNPHFVFNALSSIQGLITKNDMEGANRYLTEFSSLMRDSLKESNNEYTSLSTEIKMLESYLQLEKLRFGFSYSIVADKDINIHALEVPVLLMQPLVENAVKHGIAALYDNGRLRVQFIRSGVHMRAEISDNGDGFDFESPGDGFGLKLTRERIALLNKTLTGQIIELHFTANEEGTTVTLLFKNWLA